MFSLSKYTHSAENKIAYVYYTIDMSCTKSNILHRIFSEKE